MHKFPFNRWISCDCCLYFPYDTLSHKRQKSIRTPESRSQPVVISVQKSVQNARKILRIDPFILLCLSRDFLYTIKKKKKKDQGTVKKKKKKKGEER